MVYMLGIDTGGTFTDAVLVEDSDRAHSDRAHSDRDEGSYRIVASAKAPTSHHDLLLGVQAAVSRVLAAAPGVAAGSIALVSLSTTLATNAIVEGHGDPAALLAFGFSERELHRSGISAAVPSDLVVRLSGGHDAHGHELAPLDGAAVAATATELGSRVGAFAVVGQFSVRNPTHEREAARIIREQTGLPVTASHELSAKLDGPRRALTAALNARLLAVVDRLNGAVEAALESHGIDAPMMVVRGDGSLVSSAFAAERPIETVLSGPAASVVGALHLARLQDGLVVDIGGTTTDAAVLRDGLPARATDGAIVGEHRTMIEAVDMATVGLGGDSEVRVDSRAPGSLLLGPERAIPIGRLATTHPEIHAVLDRQLASATTISTHGRFLVSAAPADVDLADAREQAVIERLQNGPLPVAEAAPSGLDGRAAERLRARGLIRVATLTPTDAAALLGSGQGNSGSDVLEVNGLELDGLDVVASQKTAEVLARQTVARGAPLADDAFALAASVVARLERESAAFVLRVALNADGIANERASELLDASLDGHRSAASVAIGLSDPIVAIGAPAARYYDSVATMLGTTAIVPEHAEVANAIGAVVGRVRVARSATVTQPTKGQFRVHLDEQPTFGSVQNARNEALRRLTEMVTADAAAAGASTPDFASDWEERTALVGDKEVFVEAKLTVEASGRPQLG